MLRMERRETLRSFTDGLPFNSDESAPLNHTLRTSLSLSFGHALSLLAPSNTRRVRRASRFHATPQRTMNTATITSTPQTLDVSVCFALSETERVGALVVGTAVVGTAVVGALVVGTVVVGALVVGLLVGALDGDLDGLAVGLLVGALDGDLDGLAVGFLVGAFDGDLDGLAVGAGVGMTEGELVAGVDAATGTAAIPNHTTTTANNANRSATTEMRECMVRCKCDSKMSLKRV